MLSHAVSLARAQTLQTVCAGIDLNTHALSWLWPLHQLPVTAVEGIRTE